MGPMTGRGLGFCAGYSRPGSAAAGLGSGGGMGRGMGRGRGNRWRHWVHATGLPLWARTGYPPAARAAYGPPAYGPAAPEDELEMLKSQADWLRNELEAIQSRIADLDKGAS